MLLASFERYVARRGRHLVAAAMGISGGASAGAAASAGAGSRSSSSASKGGGGGGGSVATPASTLVVDLIAFRAKFSDVVRSSFGADRAFAKAARDALELAVNASGGEAPRLLAHFIDKVTRAPRSAVAVAARLRLAATPSQREGGGVGGSSSSSSSSSRTGISDAAVVAAGGSRVATPTGTAMTLEMDNR